MSEAPSSAKPAPASAGPALQENGSGTRTPGAIEVQPPRLEDLQPSYARVIGNEPDMGVYGRLMNALGEVIGTCGAVPCCIIFPNKYKKVEQGHVGLITKFGKFVRSADPGLITVNPISERLSTVDVKIQIVEVPRQSIMTKDNVSLYLSSVVFFKVIAPSKAVFGVSDVRSALVERTQTTLRHVVGARLLQDVIERREEIANDIRQIIEDVSTREWGVDVESILIKDLVFSQDLQESLSMAAQAKRTGEAKIIAARAEVESAKQMRRAADILSSAPAMQIRYLEAMTSMAKSSQSKVVFMPGPTNAGGLNIPALSDEAGPSNYEEHAADASAADRPVGIKDEAFKDAVISASVEHI